MCHMTFVYPGAWYTTSIEQHYLALRGGRTADEEPLVNAGVDRGGGLVLARWDGERGGVGAVLRVGNGDICAAIELVEGRKYSTNTYREMSPLGLLPVMRRSQASAHSRTMSMAYFLFLHSPEKANWFSGLPSGIL